MNSTIFRTVFRIVRTSIGGLHSLLRILWTAQVAVISLFSAPMVIPEKQINYQEC